MSSETIPYLPAPLAAPVYEPPLGGIPMSLAEYQQMARKSEIRYEYSHGYAFPKEGVEILPDGTIRAMSGTSPSHNRIAGNVLTHFDNAFGDRPCEAYIADIRVRASPTQYRYPDVVALCGDAQFDADSPPCLLNPVVIVEVISPSTQAMDQGQKFDEYRYIPTFTDYVLVEQDRISVRHYVRQSASEWLLTEYNALTDTLTFAGLNISITLADIYRRIVFPPPATP